MSSNKQHPNKSPLRVLASVLFAGILILSGAAAGAEAQLSYGFQAMEQLELIPFLAANGTQTKQFISYDTSGANADGGMQRFRRYDENGEYVFFDEIGPGCLYRQQANVFLSSWTSFPAEEVRIRMYFDNETSPRLDMSFAGYFGKGQSFTPPFSPPLAFYTTTFANTYYPFPFGKRFKITAYRPGGIGNYGGAVWYQYTYHKLPADAVVNTWAGPQTDSAIVRTQWNNLGQDPKSAAGNVPTSATVAVPKGETANILDLRGQGSIASLKFTMTPWTTETFHHTSIRIAWDDHAPAVDMPIGSFFGGGGDLTGGVDVSTRSLRTLFFGFNGQARTFYSYWPMPYWSRARIDIVNNSRAEITQMRLDAAYKPSAVQSYPRESCGYFGAKRTVDISPDEAYYSRAFSTRGWGKVMGLMMYSTGFAMDGDEFTYIDGSRTPQMHGDGTEDDHNQGWGGSNIQKALWGGLINGYQGAYRLYANDSYIFNSGIDMLYEHSNWGAGPTGQKTDCIVWTYMAEPGFCNLKLTDELDVGNAASQIAHSYAISGEIGTTTVTLSSYDSCEQGNPYPTTDDGRAFDGYTSFSVAIDPANAGVRIRRRTNHHMANIQRANVYVDGALIPDAPWYVCDLPAPQANAFTDSDFEIPAAYTSAKNRIAIKVQHVSAQPANSSNEYYYWVYSYGKTPLVPTPAPTPMPNPKNRAEDEWPMY